MHDDRNNRTNQQNMDEEAADVHGEKAAQPQNNQEYCKNEIHWSLSLFQSMSALRAACLQ
jgi:hypothetical protein